MDYGCDDRPRLSELECLTMPYYRPAPWGTRTDYSLPLRVPGQGHLLEKMWDEKRARRASRRKISGSMENQRTLEDKAAFVNRTSDHCQMAQLRREVDRGLRKVEEDLELKKDRLKGVILEEEERLTQEYVNYVTDLPRKLYEEKKKRAEEIMKRKSEEKGGEAKEKLEQLERENSQELKEKVSLVKRLEAAEIQKHQICENMIKAQREDEFDKYWLQLQKKRDEERLKYEEEEEQLRLALVKEQRDVLNQQILGKKIMQDEIKKITENEAAFVDQLRDVLRLEEDHERKFKAQQKKEQMKLQQAQLADCMRLKAEKQQREKEFDDYYVQKLKEEILKEKMAQHDTRAEQRREAEFFMQYLKEIRTFQAEEERQIEELRKQEVMKKESTIKQNQLLSKEAKDKLHRETLETWKEQVAHKKRVIEAQKEAERLYDQRSQTLFDVNRDLDRLLTENNKETEKERIKDLEWQQKYEEVLMKRQKNEELEPRKKSVEKEEKKRLRMQSFGTCFGPPHPFTKTIYENQ